MPLPLSSGMIDSFSYFLPRDSLTSPNSLCKIARPRAAATLRLRPLRLHTSPPAPSSIGLVLVLLLAAASALPSASSTADHPPGVIADPQPTRSPPPL